MIEYLIRELVAVFYGRRRGFPAIALKVFPLAKILPQCGGQPLGLLRLLPFLLCWIAWFFCSHRSVSRGNSANGYIHNRRKTPIRN